MEVASKSQGVNGEEVSLQALLQLGRHRASILRTVSITLRVLLSTLLGDMKQNATNCFMRNTILLGNRTKWFVVLHHTVHNYRPVFSGNTVVRVFWPWSEFADDRRRAGDMCFVMSEHILYFEIQFPRGYKEEVENW